MRNSSFYTKTIEGVYDLYKSHINCSYEDVLKRPCLAISKQLPSIEVINALEASFAYFGYSTNACIPLSLTPLHDPTEPYCLDPASMNILIEGIDPHFIIALDLDSFNVLNVIYKNSLQLNKSIIILGRPIASFENFANSLNTQEGKKKVWVVLRTMFL